MKKLLGIGLLIVGNCFSQQTNTVYQTLQTAKATTGATGAVRNIGQSQHLATFIFTNAPSQTCSGHNTDIYFEGSNDNTNWTKVGGSLPFIGVSLTRQLTATGAFSYMRVNVVAFDTTNCRLTIQYTGTLYPYSTVSEPRTFANGFLTTYTNQTTTGIFTLVPATTGKVIAVYGLFMSCSGAQEVQLNGKSIFCAANSSFVLPISGLTWYATGVNSALNMQLFAATPVSVHVVYRLDNPQ